MESTSSINISGDDVSIPIHLLHANEKINSSSDTVPMEPISVRSQSSMPNGNYYYHGRKSNENRNIRKSSQCCQLI